jgi:hypothetical protein
MARRTSGLDIKLIIQLHQDFYFIKQIENAEP